MKQIVDQPIAEQTLGPPIHLTLQEVRHIINKMLAEHFDDNSRKASAISPDYERLWRIIAETSTEGKRLRPYLTYLGYSICGGTASESALRIGAALELLHLCLLAHDDIIDKDFIRHGKPNIGGVYRGIYGTSSQLSTEADHFANSAALLAGDLLLSDAYQYFLGTDMPTDVRDRLSGLLQLAIFTVAGGELLDSEAPMHELGTDGQTDGLLIAEYKTAYYSCSAPLAMGAVLAGADVATEQQYIRFGKLLGIAYQLTDDLLGSFGDEASTGKSNMSDLRGAKQTYLLQQTYRLTDNSGRQTIDRILQESRHDDEQLNHIKRIMQDSGAKDATMALRDKYIEQALAVSAELQVANPEASRLDSFVNSLVNRTA